MRISKIVAAWALALLAAAPSWAQCGADQSSCGSTDGWCAWGITYSVSARNRGKKIGFEKLYYHTQPGGGQDRGFTFGAKRIFKADGSPDNELIFDIGTSYQTLRCMYESNCTESGCGNHGYHSVFYGGVLDAEQKLDQMQQPSGTYKVYVTMQNRNTLQWEEKSETFEYKAAEGAVIIRALDGAAAGDATLSGVTVKLYNPRGGVMTKVTSSDGLARFDGVGIGSNIKVEAIAPASHGGTTKTLYAQLSDQKVMNYSVKFFANGTPPEASEGTEGEGNESGGAFPLSPDWWVALFQKLFVPQGYDYANWTALIDKFANWGPVGFVKSFHTAFSGATRQKTTDTVVGSDAPYFCNGFDTSSGAPDMAGWQAEFCIDLRPLSETAYPTVNQGERPSKGTVFGTALQYIRIALGGLIWCMGGLGLLKELVPRGQY